MYGMRFLKAGDLGQLVQAIRKVASSRKCELKNDSKGTAMDSLIIYGGD
jgi:hypothetical protein